jgi:hypothetical protein
LFFLFFFFFFVILSLTTVASVKAFLATLLRERDEVRHFALAERFLLPRPRSSSFLILQRLHSGSRHPSLRSLLP